MKKILIVEDAPAHINLYISVISDKASVLIANNVKEAVSMFDANLDVAAVVMDACLNSHGIPDTIEIIKHIRESGYKGDIVANSSCYNEELRNAGCNIGCTDANKKITPMKLIELLGL